MADEYAQEVSGGSIGSIPMGVGMMSVNLMKFRQMQQANAYYKGPLTEFNRFYKTRSMLGYTSTVDELAAWNTGSSKFLGGSVAKATRAVSSPLLGAQMLRNGAQMQSSAAFAGNVTVGSRYAGVKLAETMVGDNVGVWLTEAMAKQGGKVASSGTGGIYNKAFTKFMGASGIVDKAGKEVAEFSGKKIGAEALEYLGKNAGARLATVGGTAASRLVGYAMPGVNAALMAWDIGTLAYYGFSGAAKIGEAVHYKIPKAYFQKSMKTFMRPRFDAIGPASVMNPENMNNRMRAVQAIQGSKLNARSALGNEAGLLHGHFG